MTSEMKDLRYMRKDVEAAVLADLNKLDAVVHELGIEDSFDEPVDCVRVLKARAEAGEARCARLVDALEKAQAAMWDAHYGNGISAGYARNVDGVVRAALSDTAPIDAAQERE